MSGNLGGRLAKLEREHGQGVGGVVVVDRRFSFVHGERPGITPEKVVRIEDSWAWESSEANHG
jgi:hypothetical protein